MGTERVAGRPGRRRGGRNAPSNRSCSRRRPRLPPSGKPRWPNYSFGSAAWPNSGRDAGSRPSVTVQVCSPKPGDLQVDLDPLTRSRGCPGDCPPTSSNLDDEYVFDWLHQFEHALDDSTLATEYNRLRKLSQVFFPIVLMIGAGPRPAPVLDAPRSVERFWENAGVADV